MRNLFWRLKKSLKVAEEPNIKLLKRSKRKSLNHVMESMLEFKAQPPNKKAKPARKKSKPARKKVKPARKRARPPPKNAHNLIEAFMILHMLNLRPCS